MIILSIIFSFFNHISHICVFDPHPSLWILCRSCTRTRPHHNGRERKKTVHTQEPIKVGWSKPLRACWLFASECESGHITPDLVRFVRLVEALPLRILWSRDWLRGENFFSSEQQTCRRVCWLVTDGCVIVMV